MATAQEVHPHTLYDGRGKPSQIASLETGVPTATPRWRLDIRGALRQETWSPGQGSLSDPYVLSDERRLFYIREGKLHAVDARTGERVWTFGVGKRARLELSTDHLIVVQQGTMHALDARTGEVRWRYLYGTPEGVKTFSVFKDLLLVIVGERLIAYDLSTGQERWRVRGLYGLTRDDNSAVLSVSGSVVLLELSYHSLTSSPISRLALIGSGLYVGHTDRQFVGVDTRTGKAFFRFRTDAENFGPTQVVGDTLVVQAGNELLAFALKNSAADYQLTSP